MTSRYISGVVSDRVRERAGNRCGYCLSPQRYVLGKLEIEHILPQGLVGTNDEDNLWLSCRLCNSDKGVQTHGRDPLTGRRVRLFNPRQQEWRRHFQWSAEGTRIICRTASGRNDECASTQQHFRNHGQAAMGCSRMAPSGMTPEGVVRRSKSCDKSVDLLQYR